MRTNTQSLFFLTALALVFTAGLTFASIELPRLLDAFLGENIDTVDAAAYLQRSGPRRIGNRQGRRDHECRQF